ncbi:MAG: hypothetical protein CM15mV135_190 [uncultured marine virus]|nr:MAG: hypothetical protein CM15mV135_190 [uncultured marine virus]
MTNNVSVVEECSYFAWREPLLVTNIKPSSSMGVAVTHLERSGLATRNLPDPPPVGASQGHQPHPHQEGVGER